MHLYRVALVLIFVRTTISTVVPIINVNDNNASRQHNDVDLNKLKYVPYFVFENSTKIKDLNEFWRETELYSLIKDIESEIDYSACRTKSGEDRPLLKIPTTRTLQPVCRSQIDQQLCPQCPHFKNSVECELFRDACKERKVRKDEYANYCDRVYGPWRAMLIPADYSKCRCCDECVFYRELDQSCEPDQYHFDMEEFLPVTTIDFRAGCNPYWGHPEQDNRALKCDPILRRCVPVSVADLPRDVYRQPRTDFQFKPLTPDKKCPVNCVGYRCPAGSVPESKCSPGAFNPDRDQCNCCGMCSTYHQLFQKCADYNRTVHKINNDTQEMEVQEEIFEPGCDDGLVCRHGICQDVHDVVTNKFTRTETEQYRSIVNEPCKQEMKNFKKKFGPEGHLHYEAPQCTPLWMYAPVQCRRFVCYCALEDGTFISGVKVPRAEVSNMNCDCAREKCRTGNDDKCDGYGNYQVYNFQPIKENLNINKTFISGESTTAAIVDPDPPTTKKSDEVHEN